MSLSKQAKLIALRIFSTAKDLNRLKSTGYNKEVTYEECNTIWVFFQAPYVRDLERERIIHETGTGVVVDSRFSTYTKQQFFEYIMH